MEGLEWYESSSPRPIPWGRPRLKQGVVRDFGQVYLSDDQYCLNIVGHGKKYLFLPDIFTSKKAAEKEYRKRLSTYYESLKAQFSCLNCSLNTTQAELEETGRLLRDNE